MPFLDLGNGNWAHINMGRQKRQRCHFCTRWAGKLCDFPTGPNKTCDARICDRCATSVGPDRDFCPRHRNQQEPAVQQSLGLSMEGNDAV